MASLQGGQSHKTLGAQSEYGLLNLYYGNANFMRLLVTGNEFFYIFLYVSFYTVDPDMSWLDGEWGGWQIAILICLPIYILKQLTNILQLKSSAHQIAHTDLMEYAKRRKSPK
uniref:CDP-diacylglycerol--inositol 3-phosphatidyltransferase n=1 Tax=Candidatus Kentrum sp. FW TaxID=2126338 RepID=A0A450U4D4_9GAMM|nr:MAG: CDP-diacylglycerol--inositol 3-phosphatidyltransferase [Candidatus Kentron sp. FW]